MKVNNFRRLNYYEGDYVMKSRFIGEIIGQLHLALMNTHILVKDVNMYENVSNWAMPKVKKIMNLSEDICKDYIEVFSLHLP